MEKKKIGLIKGNLSRKSGNFEPQDFYDDKNQKIDNRKLVDNIIPEKMEDVILNKSSNIKKTKPEFPNQNSSIKLPKSTKQELDALKLLKNIKYDYEMIGTLIDAYTNMLTSSEYKKYKLILELAAE